STDANRIAAVALSISADFKIMAGSLPPNSKKDGIKRSADLVATIRPVLTLPVKQTISTFSIKAAPLLPSPETYFKTFDNSGTLSIVLVITSINLGVISLGFIIVAQPANSAGIASINDNDSGKFQGLMIPAIGYAA